MVDYNVGDEVEMLVNGNPVDRGIVREIIHDRETGATIAKIDWQKAGRLRQWIGELRKRSAAQPKD
jgi:hypothetical protein